MSRKEMSAPFLAWLQLSLTIHSSVLDSVVCVVDAVFGQRV